MIQKRGTGIDVDITADIYRLVYARTNTDPAQAENTYCPGKPRAGTNLNTFVQKTIVIDTAGGTQDKTTTSRRAGLAPQQKPQHLCQQSRCTKPFIAAYTALSTVLHSCAAYRSHAVAVFTTGDSYQNRLSAPEYQCAASNGKASASFSLILYPPNSGQRMPNAGSLHKIERSDSL